MSIQLNVHLIIFIMAIRLPFGRLDVISHLNGINRMKNTRQIRLLQRW